MGFASFLSSGFITAIVVNPPERKLAKHTSVIDWIQISNVANFSLNHWGECFYNFGLFLPWFNHWIYLFFVSDSNERFHAALSIDSNFSSNHWMSNESIDGCSSSSTLITTLQLSMQYLPASLDENLWSVTLESHLNKYVLTRKHGQKGKCFTI